MPEPTHVFMMAGYLIVGALLLFLGAELLIRAAQSLTLRMGMSPLVVGLTVVAFATSAPELVASVLAAAEGSTDLALGNVLGSNIANIGLVLGLAAFIRPLSVHRRAVAVDTPIALAATLILCGLFAYGDDGIGRTEGILLILGIVIYTVWRVRDRNESETGSKGDEPAPLWNFAVPLLLMIIVASTGVLGAGAWFFVEGAQAVALRAGVSEAKIGLTVMALGTSLPEIATVIAAARKHMSDLVIGNVVGSNIFNILSVVGITATIIPLEEGFITLTDFSVFAGSAVLLLVMMITRLTISRSEGALLLMGYLGYVAWLFV